MPTPASMRSPLGAPLPAQSAIKALRPPRRARFKQSRKTTGGTSGAAVVLGLRIQPAAWRGHMERLWCA